MTKAEQLIETVGTHGVVPADPLITMYLGEDLYSLKKAYEDEYDKWSMFQNMISNLLYDAQRNDGVSVKLSGGTISYYHISYGWSNEWNGPRKEKRSITFSPNENKARFKDWLANFDRRVKGSAKATGLGPLSGKDKQYWNKIISKRGKTITLLRPLPPKLPKELRKLSKKDYENIVSGQTEPGEDKELLIVKGMLRTAAKKHKKAKVISDGKVKINTQTYHLSHDRDTFYMRAPGEIFNLGKFKSITQKTLDDFITGRADDKSRKSASKAIDKILTQRKFTGYGLKYGWDSVTKDPTCVLGLGNDGTGGVERTPKDFRNLRKEVEALGHEFRVYAAMDTGGTIDREGNRHPPRVKAEFGYALVIYSWVDKFKLPSFEPDPYSVIGHETTSKL